MTSIITKPMPSNEFECTPIQLRPSSPHRGTTDSGAESFKRVLCATLPPERVSLATEVKRVAPEPRVARRRQMAGTYRLEPGIDRGLLRDDTRLCEMPNSCRRHRSGQR